MIYQSNIGPISISEQNGRIVSVLLNCQSDHTPQTALTDKCMLQIEEYLVCKRKTFDLEICCNGTPFQLAVWHQLTKIPYGQTCTYGEIAKAIGNPNATRAVGGACHCNSINIIIPCHRVIGKNGALTGYAYGINMKQTLLNIEQKGLNTNIS